jgi:hypothetical protein
MITDKVVIDSSVAIKSGETHLINKGDSISITTKIFALTTTY